MVRKSRKVMTLDNKKKTVAVVGLGYIGIPFTAALANVGFRVIGVDIDPRKVASLSRDYATDIYEPGVNDILAKCRDCIEFTTDYSYALSKCEAVFITVGTPLKENDEPDYRYIDSAIASIGPHLKKGHVVVLKSTVILGTTEEYVLPRLEKLSALKAGEDFFLAFCPERTIEGLALHELYNLPKIVGGVDAKSARMAAEFIMKLGSKVVIVSSPRVAEMCKLVDNFYRATNIAFANEVGMLCEKIGINAHEVVSSVNDAYARTNLFRPGLGADGPCLSKDPMIFRYTAHKYNLMPQIANGCISTNRESTLRLASIAEDFIRKHSLKNPKVSLVGLAFKGFPETDDVRGSPAVKIAEQLLKKVSDVQFRHFDPLVKNIGSIKSEDSVSDCVKDANVVMFLTNHPRIMNVDAVELVASVNKPCLIIDAWRNVIGYDKVKDAKDVDFFRIGVG
ncbi:MAG: nucleotide sugar dehydrogenase [Candidatus Woesearchaeota archaeon]